MTRKPTRRGRRRPARRNRRAGLAYQSDARLDAMLSRLVDVADEAVDELFGDVLAERDDEADRP